MEIKRGNHSKIQMKPQQITTEYCAPFEFRAKMAISGTPHTQKPEFGPFSALRQTSTLTCDQ
jgi:hypothetical protein